MAGSEPVADVGDVRCPELLGDTLGRVLSTPDMLIGFVVSVVLAVGIVRRFADGLASELGVASSDLGLGGATYIYVFAIVWVSVTASFFLYATGTWAGRNYGHDMLDRQSMPPGGVLVVAATLTAGMSYVAAGLLGVPTAIGLIAAGCVLMFWCGMAREMVVARVVPMRGSVAVWSAVLGCFSAAALITIGEGRAIARHALAGAEVAEQPGGLLDFAVRPSSGTVVGSDVCVVRVNDSVWIDGFASGSVTVTVVAEPRPFISGEAC